MSRPLRARIDARICRCCQAAPIACPTCGTGWAFVWEAQGLTFPGVNAQICDHCGTRLVVTAVGWLLPPFAAAPPEAPGPADLSEPLATLERAYRQPPARRTRASAPTAPPCPADAPRHRLSHWAACGLVPDEVAPCAVAAAYVRAVGQHPRRQRGSRLYSLRELGLALAELGHPGPDLLATVWAAALQRLRLPSTRMLLSQQAQLLSLSETTAVVEVRGNWLAMVEARRELVAEALAEVLGHPVGLELLQGVEA
jgi:hypothetical protein